MKRENICEDKQQLDESEDLETMIANGELKIEENQKYDDVSDDDLDWSRTIMNFHSCSKFEISVTWWEQVDVINCLSKRCL